LKNTQIKNSIKNIPLGAELFHTDGGRRRNAGLFKMIVGVLTTCRTQYT